jgi:predicted O-methyltransferase YrrM
VDLRVGAALDTLPAVEAGTVIVADNVVRAGAVLDAGGSDARVQGVRSFFDMLAAEPRVSATALQTVGAKGWDGFAIALVQ